MRKPKDSCCLIIRLIRENGQEVSLSIKFSTYIPFHTMIIKGVINNLKNFNYKDNVTTRY